MEARPVPQHYASLAPFRGLFLAGVPVLTYHKLGDRPAGVRLKGLYVGARLFARQMDELRRAGFTTAGLAQAAEQPDNRARRVALTFDDGFHNVLEHGLPALARHGFRAVQFLVAARLGGTNDWEVGEGERPEPLMDAAQVREWLAAGHEIGSHSVSHPWLTRLPPQRAREEIAASKKMLEDLFGRPVEHFCYPYGDWNPAVRDLVREAGYRTACTIEFGVNHHGVSPFELRRIMARYPSRSLKRLAARLAGVWQR